MALAIERDENGKTINIQHINFDETEQENAVNKKNVLNKKANILKIKSSLHKKTNEDTDNIILNLNKVDGFDPTKYLIKIQQDTNIIEYLRVKHRILWFRLKYPNGKIVKKIVELNDKFCVVETKIYAMTTDHEDNYIANGLAQRYYTTDKLGDRYVELAETASVGRALESAGFGTQFSLENDNLQQSNIPILLPKTDNDKKNLETSTSIVQKKELNKNMTLEDAMNYVMGLGAYSSKTLGWCFENQPTIFKFFAEKYNGNDENLKLAIKLIIAEKGSPYKT